MITLKEDLARRVLLLDGAMGTLLLQRGGRAPLERMNVSASESVAAIHREYLEAGADIITTNTTCCDSLSLGEYGMGEQSYELALAGARIAREVADSYSTAERRRYVAGSVGPTTRNLTLATDTSPQAVREAYATQLRGLIEGGVDLILIETATDAQNVAIAIEQTRCLDAQIPIFLSIVPSRIGGRVLSGATIEKFLEDIPISEVMAVGLNCASSISQAEPTLKALAKACNKPIIFYPSAGQPLLEANRFAKEMESICRAQLVNVVGGCCGTTPQYISPLAKVVARWRGRKFDSAK